MGFMDRAKEAAEDLKASFATNEARDSEQAYRDLGMLAYLTTTGRPIDEADRQRLVNALYALEQRQALPPFRLVTSPPPPPPPPPAPPAGYQAGDQAPPPAFPTDPAAPATFPSPAPPPPAAPAAPAEPAEPAAPSLAEEPPPAP